MMQMNTMMMSKQKYLNNKLNIVERFIMVVVVMMVKKKMMMKKTMTMKKMKMKTEIWTPTPKESLKEKHQKEVKTPSNASMAATRITLDEEAEKSGTEVSPFDNPYYFRDACDKLDMGHLMQEDVHSNSRDAPGFEKYAHGDDKLEKLLNEIDQCEAKQNETLKSAQSYISDSCAKIGSEKKEYRCTKSTKGSAANIKSQILCQDEGSSSDSHDPFEILTKVEKVPVPRPCTPEIICLQNPVQVSAKVYNDRQQVSIVQLFMMLMMRL